MLACHRLVPGSVTRRPPPQVLYLVLAPFDSEQSSAMHALYELKALREPSSLQMYRYPPRRSRARGGADPCFRQSSYVTPQPPRCHGRKH